MARSAKATNVHATKPRPPQPLDDAAFHGLAGEVVRTIEPNTEGDPAALLVQFLVAVGFMLGRGPHFVAGADKHYTNLFCVVVGDTAKARKGTTWSWIQKVCEMAPKWWSADRVKNGLASGEGLISQVGEIASDKRLLIVESEFAAVLKVQARSGNTLSTTLRNAWDGKPLNILTKKAPETAPDGHISLIAHITHEELLVEIQRSDVLNGFANRFLWVYARRSKLLPDGGGNVDSVLRQLARRLCKALTAARRRCYDFTLPAKELWYRVYPDLSKERHGHFDAVTARAEAQVRRVAVIYCILDGEKAVNDVHLRAALAVWRYCEASAAFIFGDSTGDPLADKILGGLRDARKGMTRTEINEYLQHHSSAKAINAALDLLKRAGLARSSCKAGSGRPAERWRAV